ncbi:hypothetical protein MKX03_027767 [Papaver bracteatum]|nr:hypothetical protein MKX03_027767 [Papaver bracteatum]
MEKPIKGKKRKIDIVKIDNQANRQVTFAKRRKCLFKKASELCVLCGAELAIIVFSPARKAFVFGHPDPTYIINRFLTGHEDLDVTGYYNERVVPVQKQYMEVVKQLDVEKKKDVLMNKLQNRSMGGDHGCWWDAPMDGLSLNELELMKSAMEDVQRILIERVKEMMSVEASCLSSMLVPYGGEHAISTNNALVNSSDQTLDLGEDTFEATVMKRVSEMMSDEASSLSSSMLVPYPDENATSANDAFFNFSDETSVADLDADTFGFGDEASSLSSMLVPYIGENATSANDAFFNFSDETSATDLDADTFGFSDAFLITCQTSHPSSPKSYDISELFSDF